MHALLALSTQSLLDPNFLRRLFLEKKKKVLTFAPMWPNLVTAVSPRSFPLIRSLSCVFIYWSSGLYIRCLLPSRHQPSCADWVDVRVRCLPSRVEGKHCAQGLSMFDPTVRQGARMTPLLCVICMLYQHVFAKIRCLSSGLFVSN